MSGRRDDPLAHLDLPLDPPQVAGDDAWIALALTRLRTEIARGCPVRAVQASPIKDVGRIVFADGTVLLARSHHRGVLTELSFEAAAHGVIITGCERTASGLEAMIDAGRGRVVEVTIVGVDQPD